jgi:hypothetical protein
VSATANKSQVIATHKHFLRHSDYAVTRPKTSIENLLISKTLRAL